MIVHYKLSDTQSTSTTTAAAAAAATKPNPDKNVDLGQCCPTPILHACMCFKLSNTHALFTDHKHHSEVANYLRTLPNGEVTRLGLALGLTYPKLNNMLHCPDDMVDAWLRKEENVLYRKEWKTNLDIAGKSTEGHRTGGNCSRYRENQNWNSIAITSVIVKLYYALVTIIINHDSLRV